MNKVEVTYWGIVSEGEQGYLPYPMLIYNINVTTALARSVVGFAKTS